MTKVSLVPCKEYDSTVYAAVKRAIELSGGCPTGKKVLVKPNMLAARMTSKAVCTHPAVLDAVITVLKENNNSVIVGDSPAFHDPLAVAKVSGILDVCTKNDVSFVVFKDKTVFKVDNPHEVTSFELTSYLNDVDCVVNVPKMKTHTMMGVTLAVKNTFGLLVALDKAQKHVEHKTKDKFAGMLCDLSNTSKSVLHIVDGIVGMEGDGPASGTPIKSSLIAASTDAYALDITLCKVMGIDPKSITTNQLGLSRKSEGFADSIDVVGSSINDVFVRFKEGKDKSLHFQMPDFLTKIVRSLLMTWPVVDPAGCDTCKECIKHCPSQSIHLRKYKNKDVAHIDRQSCIRCFSCCEVCPKKAISVKRSRAGDMLEAGRMLAVKALRLVNYRW